MAQPTKLTDLSRELLTRVLNSTFSGEKPATRQQHRSAFALVCKEFNRVVNQDFAQLDIFGTEGMEKAYRRLWNPADQRQVKKVYLQLASTRGKNKESKFRDLMERLQYAIELEFVVSAKNMETVERALFGSLTMLTRITRFTLRPHKRNALPLLDSDILRAIVPHWEHLRSISLNVHMVWPAERETISLFRPLEHLHTIEFITDGHDCDRLFVGPPSSLRTIILSQPNLYVQDTLPEDLLNALGTFVSRGDDDALDGWVPEIHHVTSLVLDDHGSPQVPGKSRGMYEPLLRSMVDLRSLTCGPCVVNKLVELAVMPRLRELVLVEDRVRLTPSITSVELLDMISQGTLRKVSIGESLKTNWSGSEQVAVKDLASRKRCVIGRVLPRQ